MAQPYPSLNLGQAVMIYAYTLSGYAPDEAFVLNNEVADKDGFRVLMDRLRLVLTEMGIDKNPALYNRLLERLAWLGEDDIHLVHSVLNRYMSLREGI